MASKDIAMTVAFVLSRPKEYDVYLQGDINFLRYCESHEVGEIIQSELNRAEFNRFLELDDYWRNGKGDSA